MSAASAPIAQWAWERIGCYLCDHHNPSFPDRAHEYYVALAEGTSRPAADAIMMELRRRGFTAAAKQCGSIRHIETDADNGDVRAAIGIALARPDLETAHRDRWWAGYRAYRAAHPELYPE